MGGREGGVIRPRIKVCCIANAEEARLAIRHGAAALGLVSRMPGCPGVIGEPAIAAIAAIVPPGVATFLLTAETETEAIVRQQRRTGTGVLQLVDRVAPSVRRDLRRRLPGIGIVQVVHVQGASALEEAVEAARDSDAILLDSGAPDREVRELGGTGRTHDWSISRAVVEAVTPVPVFLAGGLTPENVGEAVGRVRPWGLDACTGLRTAGDLDPTKLARFMDAVRTATPDGPEPPR